MRKELMVEVFQPQKYAVANLCYTDSMQDPHLYWNQWAQKLHSMGVSGLAAAFISGAGAFRLLAAQIVHAGTPFLSSSRVIDQWQALAAMLEDKDSSQEFVSLLREEDSI